MMTVKNVWGTIDMKVYPKGVQWGLGQGSVQALQDLTHQT